MPAKKNAAEAETFETALEKIERIAAQMERGDLPLDQLVVAYEEALRLVRYCSERLDDAEKRLQTITRDAAGQPLGLATVGDPEEIPSSTVPESSATEDNPTNAGASSDPVRLF
jgi:exodeoxyribonuclease VII small subunit